MSLPAERLVTRLQWGARPPRSTDPFSERRGWAIHWTGSPLAAEPHWPTCYDQVAGVQRFHMDTRGWPDIGYSFVVCNHGFIFEGRGWDAQPTAQGTAAGNDTYAAVALIIGPGQTPTEAGLVGMVLVVTEGRSAHAFKADIKPHSFFKATPCPGPALLAEIAAGRFAPFPAPLPPTPALDVPILAPPTADLARLQRWGRVLGEVRFVEVAFFAHRSSLELGVDPAVTYAIMAHETGYGRFGGIVPPAFHNWGGIKTAAGGADDDPAAHAQFPTDEVGVLAVTQHAARYGGADIPPELVVDPRYSLIRRGQAPTLLSPGWTWAGPDHGPNVVRKVGALRTA